MNTSLPYTLYVLQGLICRVWRYRLEMDKHQRALLAWTFRESSIADLAPELQQTALRLLGPRPSTPETPSPEELLVMEELEGVLKHIRQLCDKAPDWLPIHEIIADQWAAQSDKFSQHFENMMADQLDMLLASKVARTAMHAIMVERDVVSEGHPIRLVLAKARDEGGKSLEAIVDCVTTLADSLPAGHCLGHDSLGYQLRRAVSPEEIEKREPVTLDNNKIPLEVQSVVRNLFFRGYRELSTWSDLQQASQAAPE